MRYCLRLPWLALLFATFLWSSAYAENLDTKVNQWMKRNGIPGAAIQIHSNGVTKSYYYGYANKEAKTPVTKDTIFEIASLTKILTTVILADEIHAGRMKLNDTLAQYITDIPATPQNRLNDITLENLATHTSGFPFNAPRQINSRKKLARFFSKWRNPSPVGSQWLYSNINIGLLGFLLETHTQKTIYELYDEKILRPLGMRSSGAMIADPLLKNYAQGYNMAGMPAPRRNKKEWISPPNSDWIFPATGSLKSSGSDMAKFLRASLCLPGTPPDLAEAMKLTQTSFVATPRFHQGLAWVIHPDPVKNKAKLIALKPKSGPYPTEYNLRDPNFNGNALMEKTGASGGFRSYIAVIPNHEVGVVILVNRYITSAELIRMGRELALNQIS
jgi:beta-lactamase class C